MVSLTLPPTVQGSEGQGRTFSVGAEDLNLGPHTCIPSALTYLVSQQGLSLDLSPQHSSLYRNGCGRKGDRREGTYRKGRGEKEEKNGGRERETRGRQGRGGVENKGDGRGEVTDEGEGRGTRYLSASAPDRALW